MKNTMKKLLCMALVIMLLISAVPMFAAADDLDLSDRVLVYEFYDQDGNFIDRVTGTDPAGVISTDDIASGAQWWMGSKCPGCTYVGLGAMDITQAGKAIFRVNVNKPATAKVSIIIRLNVKDDKAYNYQVGTVEATEVPETMSKENALLKLNGAADSLNVNITSASATKDLNGSEAVYAFSAEKKTVTPPASTNVTLTVNYTGDRSGTVTLSVPANTTVSATDIANAIKSQLGVSSLTISGFPTVTVTENTTIGGVQVSGVNAVNYTLTIKVSGDYTGTAYKTVPAGTSVTEADIKAEIKNDLGITSSFNVDVPGAPIVMNCSQTVYVNATKITGSSSSSTNKFPYDVYLNIYKDTLVGSADKSVKITNGIALDGLVTLAEVKNVVKNYYSAKDSDGISYDGLYLAQGNWVADYVADTKKYDSIDAGEMRQTGTVYINVMIGNAKAKSSSTADTSNYKTGDTIFVPVMAMGLTGTLLAAAYIFGKKRFAR